MEKKEIILQKTADGQIAESLKNLGLSIDIDNGNTSISGQREILTAMGNKITHPLDYMKFSTRLNDPIGVQTVSEQEESKRAIFAKLNAAVLKALETAVQAIETLYKTDEEV